LLGFLLFPFDFVLSRSDLHQRLAELPHLLFAVPGAGRQFPWVMIAAVLAAVETAPLGMLIGFHCRRHCVLVAGVIGLCGMAGICLLQMVILGATPSIIAVLYRSFGIVAGAVTVRSITLLRLLRWRLALARAVPGLALFYLLAVLLTKDVAGADWRTPEEAWAALDVRGLWPFWHAYIVSKPHAVQSIVAHVVMYAPIGVMVWLRRGDRQHGRVLATTLAVTLSSVVEIGRWFRPGLQPDFTNLIIAGCAAWFAIPLSEWMWRALAESFPIPGLPPIRGPSTFSTRIGKPARMPREAG
jgi:hypothetical protein